MDIKTYIRPHNVKIATKILRKGRGAWGDFVNSALEAYPKADVAVNDMEVGKHLAKGGLANPPKQFNRERL